MQEGLVDIDETVNNFVGKSKLGRRNLTNLGNKTYELS